MEESSLAHQTIKNASYNMVGYVLPILVSLFITPVIVHKIGISDYGIFLLVNTILVFLGLLDLGLSTATIKYLSEYQARNDSVAVKKLLCSVNSIFLIIGSAGLAAFLLLGKWFLPIFKITGQSQQHIFIVFLLAGLVFFLNTINSVYMLVAPALQRYDIVNKINLTNAIATSIFTLGLVMFGFKLKAIMLMTLAINFGAVWAYRKVFKELLPSISLGLSWDKMEIKKVYKFGVATSVSSLAVNVLAYFDRLIIPIFVGPAALTFYSIPGNVAIKVSGVTNSLASMLFPMASAISGRGEHERMGRIYIKVFRNLTIITTAMVVSIMLFAEKILYFWMGPEFAQKGTVVLLILAVTYFFSALYTPLHSFLLGMGKTVFLMYVSTVMAVINLIALLLLVPKFGIIGAAWAYLISVLPVLFIFYWTEVKYLQLTGQLKFYIKLYSKLAFTTVLFIGIVKLFLLKLVTSFVSLVVVGPTVVLLFLLIYHLFGFTEQEDNDIYKSFILKIIKR